MSGNPNKVYVGGLHDDTKKADLEDFFKDMGTITSVWIARQPPGFGFVEFEDERDAADACKRLNGKELLGKSLSVEISGGRKTSRRSRSPRRSRSRGRRSSRDRSRERSRERERRRKELSPSKTRPSSRFSGSGPPPDTGTMTTLKIGNLSRRSDQQDLRKHFDKYGEIGDVYIPLDPRSKEPRGFAFVRFYNKRDAKDAEKALDGSRMDGRVLEVQMAKYGRPDRFGDAKKVSRSSSPKRSKSRSRGKRSRSRSSKRSPSKSRSPKRDRGGRDRKRSSSRKRSPSPKDKKRSGSPKARKRSSSPKDRKRSSSIKDRKRSSSPRKRSSSPRKRSSSPKDRKRSGSPKKDQSKSKSRSPNPRKASHSLGREPSATKSPKQSRSRSRS